MTGAGQLRDQLIQQQGQLTAKPGPSPTRRAGRPTVWRPHLTAARPSSPVEKLQYSAPCADIDTMQTARPPRPALASAVQIVSIGAPRYALRLKDTGPPVLERKTQHGRLLPSKFASVSSSGARLAAWRAGGRWRRSPCRLARIAEISSPRSFLAQPLGLQLKTQCAGSHRSHPSKVPNAWRDWHRRAQRVRPSIST